MIPSINSLINRPLLTGGKSLVKRWALFIDFLSGPLDPRITFTRADATTCATYFDSAGLLKTVAANVPRFDYDPATLLPKGLLIEESRVNNFLNSDFAGTNLTTQSVTVTAAPWSVSFTGTGTITFSGAFVGSLVGSGANTRVSTTFTPSAGSLTCTVTGTVKWAQAELGAAASSFIPTAASTVTRAADNASMTGTNFSSWFSATQGTFVVEYIPSVPTGYPTNQYVVAASDGTLNNRIAVFRQTGGPAAARVISAAASQLALAGQSVAQDAIVKSALSYGGSSSGFSVNGVSTADGGATAPTGVTQLSIGQSEAFGTSLLNGRIRSIRYYNTRLPNATMQALTT